MALEQRRESGFLDPRDPVFRKTADALPHLMLIVRANGLAEYWNATADEYFGAAWSPDDAVRSAQLVERFVHPAELTVFAQALSRAAFAERVECEIRLRAPDGSYRRMSALVRGLETTPGRPDRFMVVAHDVEERRRAEERMRLLVRAGEFFHQSLDVRQTLSNVAQLMVRDFCDLCIVDLREGRDRRLAHTAAAHRDPHRQHELHDFEKLLYQAEYRAHPVIRVAQTGEPFFLPRIDERVIQEQVASAEHAQFMRSMGYASKIVVPIVAAGEIFGALTFVLTGGDRFFDAGDLEFSKELARRTGLAVQNAQRYMREHRVAVTLQHAFVPEAFPARAGVSFDALYRPAESSAILGGDWYDVFQTRRGDIVFTIGDVTGSGIVAARMMVQLREAIRIATVRTIDPAAIVRMANDALFVERGERYATAWVGVIPQSGKVCTYASAGHPPPFLRYGDGTVEELVVSGQMLGVARECRVQSAFIPIDQPLLLVLYTDGLTELHHDLTAGEHALAAALRDDGIAGDPAPAHALERALVQARSRDDLAILTVRFTPEAIANG